LIETQSALSRLMFDWFSTLAAGTELPMDAEQPLPLDVAPQHDVLAMAG